MENSPLIAIAFLAFIVAGCAEFRAAPLTVHATPEPAPISGRAISSAFFNHVPGQRTRPDARIEQVLPVASPVVEPSPASGPPALLAFQNSTEPPDPMTADDHRVPPAVGVVNDVSDADARAPLPVMDRTADPSKAGEMRALPGDRVVTGQSAALDSPAPPAFRAMVGRPYRLVAGDRIRVTVFAEDDLTNSYLVNPSGNLAFPLIGRVPAQGLTAEELEELLKTRLRQGYLRDPDITVQIDRYQPIFVWGEVAAAGRYAWVPGLTVERAIAAAGGFTRRAERGGFNVTRAVDGKPIIGRLAASDAILPGDMIYVVERDF